MAERMKIWIANVMKELMKTKSLDEIRVSEICDIAEIERSTFYYHFRDKYDLVAWIYVQTATGMDISDFQSAAESLERMKTDYQFYKQAYADHSQNALRNYILEYYETLYEQAVKERLSVDRLDEQTVFSIKMFVYGGIAMSREWLMSDTAAPALDVTRMMFRCMPQDLKEIFADASGPADRESPAK